MRVNEQQQDPSGHDWQEANHRYLNDQLRRLRLLLQRRVRWLRCQWQHDPLQTYRHQVISNAQADWLLAGEDQHAEMHFYHADPGAAAISRSIQETEQALTRQAQALQEAEASPALEVLGHLFGLTPFEQNVLLLCLAPELDPTFAQLYAYVQDDVTRKYATPHLALTLFAHDSGDQQTVQASFLPQAPLRRLNLVICEVALPGAPSGARPLRLDERIADYIRGINRPDERMADLLRPLPPALLASSHHELVDRLARVFEAQAGRGPWPLVNLIGPPEVGKRAVAAALCDHLGLRLSQLEAGRLLAPGVERQDLLRVLEREAVLLQFACYLDASELDLTDKALAAALHDVVERLGIFFIVGSRERWQCERDMVAVQVPKLDAHTQRDLWRQALADSGQKVHDHIETIVQQFDFGPQAISRAVTAAQNGALLRTQGEEATLTAADLWQACREQVSWRLDELAQRILPCYTRDDIVLPEEASRQLVEIAAQVTHRPHVYEKWGFGAKLSRGRGISALFAGPSGTGKTMAAEVLANQLQLDLYRIDLAGVVSKYIGETEKNLKKVFDAAEQSGAILLFDEADALFGKRTEVKDSHDRYANIEVNYLLQRMEEYRGLAILATNRKSALDQAFLRRLRFLVDFPFPDAESRRRIWRKVFPPQAAIQDLDYAALARLDIPGGNIKNIALNAAFLAADAGAPIGMDHILHAARREYVKVEKIITQSEFGYQRQAHK